MQLRKRQKQYDKIPTQRRTNASQYTFKKQKQILIQRTQVQMEYNTNQHTDTNAKTNTDTKHYNNTMHIQ